MRPILSFLLTAGLLVATALPAAATSTATGKTDLKTTSLAVKNMSCSVCRITIGKALKQVDGVVDAKVDFQNKTATVRFDPAKTDVTALTQATAKVGYPSSPKK